MPPKTERELRVLAELRLSLMTEENDRLREQLRGKVKELRELEWRALRAEDEVAILNHELASARASVAIALKVFDEEKAVTK